MATRKNRAFSNVAIPPGEFLEEEIQARSISLEELATFCNEPIETLAQAIKGVREITPALAASLEKALGIKASVWINLEEGYKEVLARTGQARATALEN
jgi:HTH-type transcriptional regulator/antitoxin HigA